MSRTLQGAARPLVDLHDVALLDLDGVVYIGPEVVPGAAQALAAARERGMRLAFVTNNAARTPHQVADHLAELGVAAKVGEIVTSAQAAARYLADRLPGAARVLVVGTDGLTEALRERGLTPVDDARTQVDAVVQGYSPGLTWAQLAEGAIAINRGVLWVATNLDPTVPSPRGRLPGNGSLVAALRHATGREPVATGKPDPTMHRESVLRSKAERPIVVGDRLDTDIEGANAAGCASLLVFTGVTDPGDVLTVSEAQRPTYLARDLAGLLVAHPAPVAEDGAWSCGRWRARVVDGVVELASSGDGDEHSDRPARSFGADLDDDVLDSLRAMCPAAWSRPGEAGAPGSAVVVRAVDQPAHDALTRLGLDG